jgi:AcrR family transcriptional regulator
MKSHAKRPYRSERRQEGARRTREQILDAATASFVERGYAGTTIAAVAAAAGTAAETVYATFGTKAALLEAALRRAARGDDQTEILSQPIPRRTLAEDDRREALRLFAGDVTKRLERVAPLLAVAAAEPSLADLHRKLHHARLRSLSALAPALGATDKAAAETIWAFASPELYLLLTRTRGWSARRYTSWLTDTLAALFDLRGRPDGGPATPP